MFLFRILLLALAGAGILGLIAAASIANPTKRLPELAAISDGVKGADRSEVPALRRFQARDGSFLAFRQYPAAGTAKGAAVLIHGSSGTSIAVHPLARVLAARGIEVFAPDIRGHGASGTRGDIAYLGQLDDDLSDLVGQMRSEGVATPISLVGHSSGGGFALRIAGSKIQDLFAQSFLLAPWLGTSAPSSRSNAGGWASPNLPRIIALSVLRNFGITCCDHLPVIAFAVPRDSARYLTAEYSMRLLTNFGAARDYQKDLNAARRPITIIAAADDELMFSDKYAEAVRGTTATTAIRVLDHSGHMDVVTKPAVIARVADIIVEETAK